MGTLHILRFVPSTGGPLPVLEADDVVRVPSGREAAFVKVLNNDRMLLRYLDDGSEVVLQPKLLAFVRRADGHAS